MSIEAMKQALEFLESGDFVYPTKIATDLRQAIEQQEKQEPVAWISPSGNLYRTRYLAVANGEQAVTPLYATPHPQGKP